MISSLYFPPKSVYSGRFFTLILGYLIRGSRLGLAVELNDSLKVYFTANNKKIQ